ncbi:MAG: PepSY domain-containing protein [Thioclava marina]|uniref:PepSY domain-containing protein n=1 Tax=Thioclava marina TaxID=1915077 RepID=UPI0019C0860C|nr:MULTISPECIES: PepSY domain-containing protein [Thioclava]MBC7144924.1 PepSY domain-containing protein [Thioclava marina]MBD3803064.1 PepSY domain-containing protein [Thioclava sp.]
MKSVVTFLLVLLLASPALAQRSGGGAGNGGGGNGGGNGGGASAADHDRARSAVERNEILPLNRILANLREYQRGRVIKVDLEQIADRYIYALKLITPEGRLLELEVDAATGLPIAKAGKSGLDEGN